MPSTPLQPLEPRHLFAGANDIGGDTADDAKGLGNLAAAVVQPESVTQRTDPVDWFRVTLKAPTLVDLDATGDADGLSLRVHNNPSKAPIAYKAVAGELTEAFTLSLDPGTYFIRVGLRGDGAPSVNYTLSLTGASATPELGSITAKRGTSGQVGRPGNQTDFFNFTIDNTTRFAAALARHKADANLELQTRAGGLIAGSYNAGLTTDRVEATLTPGDYTLVVRSADPAATWYRLALKLIDTPDTLPDVPDVPASEGWSLNAINAPEAWAWGATGKGVLVAVIDTGIDFDHPDLAGRLYTNPNEIPNNGIDDDNNGYTDDVSGWDFVNNTPTFDDTEGHGSAVAGIIAANRDGSNTTGIAPDATILPLRALESGNTTLQGIADAIRYAVDQDADIINLSVNLGTTASPVITSALTYARDHDVFVTTAAGNDDASTPVYPARSSATLTNVLAAGAFDQSLTILPESNAVGSSGAVMVDAPGKDIRTTFVDGRYVFISGTSMAAPAVAGLAALALSVNPDLTATQLRALIVQHANLTITNSDAQGGINAATTIPAAINFTG